MASNIKRTTLTSEAMLSDGQLKAVGCLALESTRLETDIEQMIVDHCGDTIGRLLIERKMLDAKVDIFKAVFVPEALDDKSKKDLDQLYGEIKSDIAKRNTVIHGSWQDRMSMSDWYKRLNDRSFESNPTVHKKSMMLKASEVMALAHRFGLHQKRLFDWYLRARRRRSSV